MNASSARIDREVEERLRAALSIYQLEEDTLRSLRPDVLITQTQCDVCAVSLTQVEAHLATWQTAPRLAAMRAVDMASLWQDIRAVGAAARVESTAEDVVLKLQARCAELAAYGEGLPSPRVVCIEWLDPIFAAGNWVPELVALAGGEAGEHSGKIDWQTICDAARKCLF